MSSKSGINGGDGCVRSARKWRAVLLLQLGFNTSRQLVVRHILAHAGADTGHHAPVVDILLQTGNKRPLAAHARFHRMNAAIAFMEDAIAVRTLD